MGELLITMRDGQVYVSQADNIVIAPGIWLARLARVESDESMAEHYLRVPTRLTIRGADRIVQYDINTYDPATDTYELTLRASWLPAYPSE